MIKKILKKFGIKWCMNCYYNDSPRCLFCSMGDEWKDIEEETKAIEEERERNKKKMEECICNTCKKRKMLTECGSCCSNMCEFNRMNTREFSIQAMRPDIEFSCPGNIFCLWHSSRVESVRKEILDAYMDGAFSEDAFEAFKESFKEFYREEF